MNSKFYDLEERTFQLAKKCREFSAKLTKNQANHEDVKQLIRSSGSQAANYIEANEALSKKDRIYRVRICRKEAKETGLWLKLIDVQNEESLGKVKAALLQETIELRKIFTTIENKLTKEIN